MGSVLTDDCEALEKFKMDLLEKINEYSKENHFDKSKVDVLKDFFKWVDKK